MHRIWSRIVRGVFGFYKSYNVLYESVFSRDDVLDEDYPDDFVDRYFFEHVEDNGSAYNDSLDAEQETIRGHADVGYAEGDEDEESILGRRISLMDDASPVMASEHPLARGTGEVPAKDREFMVVTYSHVCFRISFHLGATTLESIAV
ncbi:hypothetical protein V7S43_011520 [Phytophthora oleae]|uniref:Uncharacterized protein n=1 Tax=Phytophthora oleae TaxID=2107226 RepID=A0ABD3FF58_9STRA